MLKDTLEKIVKPKTPFEQLFKRKEPFKYSKGKKPLKEVFSDNEQKILFERLTASLREVANGIKEQMKGEAKKLVLEAVDKSISKIRIPRDGINGKDGRGIDGRDGKDGKDAIIDEKKIISELAKLIPPVRISGKRGGGGDTIIPDDLSSQCDGATRVFTATHKIGKPILVVSSQFPNVLRLTTDFTNSTTILTLDSALPFIASGQTLYFVYAEG